MKKKPRPAPVCALPPFAVGSAIEIARPHLWSGCRGIVESYNPITTKHLVKIAGKNGEQFHAEAFASELRAADEAGFRGILGL